MTPRLRILSIGLALSLTYAIYDYIDRNSNKKPVIEKKKRVNKRPSTARVSLSRGVALKKRVESRANKQNAQDKKDKLIPQKDFLPISDDISMLEGWSRNPFVEWYEPLSTTHKVADQTIVEQPVFTTLDGLNIETAVRMGDKAYVTINGQTFKEGDLINNVVIERIENQKIIFRVGKIKIIKDVGT